MTTFIRFLPPLISLATGLFLFIFPFGAITTLTNSDIAKLCTIILSYLVADTFVRYFNNDSLVNLTKSIRSDFNRILDSDTSVQYLGKSLAANKIIAEKIKACCQVRNTILTNRMDFISRAENEILVSNAYLQLLKGNASNNWFDIVSTEVKGLDRFEILNSTLSENDGKLLIYAMNGETITTHINFIILDYPDGAREVFFGWLFSEEEGQSEIFGTRDPRMVSLFQSYFSSLRQRATIIPATLDES